jgi:hypothetical protein
MPSFSLRAVPRLVALAAGAAALSACLSIEEANGNNRYGSITIQATGGTSGSITASPVAAFFRGIEVEIPTSQVSSDNCGIFPFTREAFAPGNLEAGSTLQLRVGGDAYQMEVSAAVPRLYVLADGGSFDYDEGDSARVIVPGTTGGFPGSQVAVKLAEPIRLGPITGGEINQDLPVSWQANGDANSSVIISLRYTSSFTSTLPDAQVLCIVRDNGGYAVPGTFLGNYYASNPASRELNVLRWRTNNTRVDERTVLYIVSTVDTTLVLPGTP